MHCISFLGPRESQGKSLPRVWNTTSDLGLLPLLHSNFVFTFVNSPFFFFLTHPIIVGQSFTLGESWHIAVGLSQVLYVAESEGCTRWLKGWHPKNENHMFNWVLSICAQVRLTIVCGAYGNVWFCMPAICKSYILSYPILPINFSGEQTHSQLTTVVINE